ncbi:MAG TPA: MFS transporter [Angustibacter sp.]|nr:MFS transporter [Angustibacter sp.]
MGDDRLARRRALVAAGFFAQGLTFATLLTHLPAYTHRWDVGDAAVTALVFGVSVCAGAGSVAVGAVALRRGSASALTGAVGFLALGAALTVLAPVKAAFFAAFLLWGLAVGAVDATMNMQAVDVQSAFGRSVLAQFHGVWSLGGIVGALWTSADGRWHVGLTPSVLVVAAVVLAIAVARAGLGGARSTGPVAALPGVEPAPDAGTGLVPWRAVALVGGAVVCFYVVDSGISSWSSLYLHDVLRASPATAAIGFAAYQATSLVSRALADLAVRRVGSVPVVRASGVVGAAGLALVVLAPAPAVAIVGFAVTGLGLAVIAPLAFATTDHLAPAVRDVTIARLNLSNYLGFVVGGVLVGVLGAVGDLRLGYLAPLLFALAVVGLAPAFAAVRRVEQVVA